MRNPEGEPRGAISPSKPQTTSVVTDTDARPPAHCIFRIHACGMDHASLMNYYERPLPSHVALSEPYKYRFALRPSDFAFSSACSSATAASPASA